MISSQKHKIQNISYFSNFKNATIISGVSVFFHVVRIQLTVPRSQWRIKYIFRENVSIIVLQYLCTIHPYERVQPSVYPVQVVRGFKGLYYWVYIFCFRSILSLYCHLRDGFPVRPKYRLNKIHRAIRPSKVNFYRNQ